MTSIPPRSLAAVARFPHEEPAAQTGGPLAGPTAPRGRRARGLSLSFAVASAACLAYAVHRFMLAPACGDTGQSACDGGVLLAIPMLIAGIAGCVLASFTSARGIAFALTFAAVALGALIDAGDAPDPGFAYLFGGIFAAITVLLIGLGLWLRPKAQAAKLAARRLALTGRDATATILDVRDTGITVNEDPLVELRVRIRPADRSPGFEQQTKTVVSRARIPREGDERPVRYDPADPATWAFVRS